eukprot:scaffold22734_cov74-Skeletonema_menzelii.AAC.2
MFSTKRQSSESITETKNIAAWESLISDLSESRPDDDDDGDDSIASDDSDDDVEEFINGSAAGERAALPPPLFNGEEKMDQKLQNPDSSSSSRNIASESTTNNVTTAVLSSQAPSRTLLEAPTYLNDWITYYSIEYPPHVNYMGRKMDDKYILNAAQIALSLAKYLGRNRRHVGMDDTDDNRRGDMSSCTISCEDIRVDNVMVKNLDSGEAVLKRRTNGAASNTERRQVLALGITFYELFTQGKPPPRQIQQSLKSTGSVLSFGTSLRISESNEDGDDRVTSEGSRRKNKDEEGADDNSAQESFVRKQRRRHCDEGKEESVPTLLKRA